VNAPSLASLAAAALAVLARDGARSGEATQASVDGAIPLELSCAGPDLPADVPAEIATPTQVMRERPWTGRYRLVVRASRLIVLDLYWAPGEAVRIMGFSRGDWERALLGTAAR
jgi:hypothetical protein